MTKYDKIQGSSGLLTQLTLAGAAALAGSAVNAQIVVVPVNQNIGFAPGDLSSFTSALPGANQFTLQKVQLFGIATSNGFFKSNILLNGLWFSNSYVKVRAQGYFTAARGPAGKTFSQIGTHSRNSSAIIDLVAPNGHVNSFQNEYFAFTFQDTTKGNQTDYGWIQASLTNGAYNGLTLDIIAYAYDSSGALIKTGDRGIAPVPEPSSSLALAALSALTLGAAGVRRLKALKD